MPPHTPVVEGAEKAPTVKSNLGKEMLKFSSAISQTETVDYYFPKYLMTPLFLCAGTQNFSGLLTLENVSAYKETITTSVSTRREILARNLSHFSSIS